MALFENYEGRMPQLQPVLEKYGFANFDEVKAYTNSMGVDAYSIVESTQPICFENVKWAYELGAAIAMKKNAETAAKAAEYAADNLCPEWNETEVGVAAAYASANEAATDAQEMADELVSLAEAAGHEIRR